jgi:archaellum biogenesis ATPase FlaH
LGGSPNPLKNTRIGGYKLKNKRITLRVSEADWQKLHDKADAARMTLTDYLTACGLQKEIIIIDGMDEVIRQQKGIGRNLNQLATLANMGKVNTVYLQELADAHAQVSSLLSEILKRRRWS